MSKDKQDKAQDKTLEGFADEKAAAVHAENESIARANRVLRTENATLRERAEQAEREVSAREKEIALYVAPKAERPDWLMPKKPEPTAATVMVCLSDIHAGETVNPAEIGGYNKFNLAICQMRLERFFAAVVEKTRSWSGHEYDGIVLAVIGDLVSGDIHDELEQTNELTTYETARWLYPRLAEGIDLWRKAFKRVHVASAPGNHGRDSKIPRYKKRSAHNADTHIMHLVADQFAKVDSVSFEIPESLDATLKVYDFDISLEHGDELARSFSGTAEIGPLGPLIRGTNRKRNALAATGREMHYALWGHFHRALPVPSSGMIANGAIKGFDEYALGLKLRPEPPQQVLAIIEPERGCTDTAPIFVGDRRSEKW